MNILLPPEWGSLLNRTSIEPHSAQPIINCQEDEYSICMMVTDIGMFYKISVSRKSHAYETVRSIL